MPTTQTPPAAIGNGTRTRQSPRPSDAIGATAKATARNRTRIITGVFVLVVSALVTGLLYANAGNRHAVVAIARPVAAGQIIQAADLREVLAGSVDGIRTTRWAARASVVGKTAAVNLVPGSLLNPAQVATKSFVDPSAAIVGAVLKPGQFPAGLRPGDTLLAIVLPPEAAAADGEADVATPIVVTVAAIEPVPDTAGAVSVSLAVQSTEAATLAIAGARGRLVVVLAPR